MGFIQKNIGRAKFVTFSVIDFIRFQFSSKTKNVSKTKKILFVGDHLQARIPRIAKLLNQTKEFETFLITLRGKDYSHYNTAFFNKQITYRTYWDLKIILKKEGNCELIHAFGPPNWATKICIKTGLKTIMDCQDMNVSYYGLNPPFTYMKFDLPNEKFCIENCSGLISQSIEPYDAIKEYSAKKPKKTLFFPLFCDKENLIFDAKKIDDNQLHIVYVGMIAGSFQDNLHYGAYQLKSLIKKFNSQKVNFHIYPSPNIDQNIIEEYKIFESEFKYFHLHKSVSQNKLAREISKYHFGILPFFDYNNKKNKTKRRRGTSLKIFNYIEAQLPILISEDMAFQNWIVTRHSAGISINYSDLSNIINKTHLFQYDEMIEKLTIEREKIILQNQFYRLEKFYDNFL